jgi:radical SAM superfamily enzyme YgiQ (UPF0313 family)
MIHRIVLVQLHLEERPEAVPLGIACVASALKAAFPENSGVPGSAVQGMAEQGQGFRERDDVSVDISLVEGIITEGVEVLTRRIEAASVLRERATESIGFSLYNWNRSLCIEIAGKLREKLPGLFLFCGGPEVTALPGGLHKSQGGPFDAAITGEGETGAVNLLRECFFPESPPSRRDLPAKEAYPESAPQRTGIWFPSPWLDGTLEVRGRNGVLWEIARGCPYSCAYCYESKGNTGAGNRRVRYIAEDRFREELKLFVRERIPYVFVLDPTFNTDNNRAVGILDLIEKEVCTFRAGRGNRNFQKGDSPTHWHFEVRAELITREQARRFARIGASLQIGLQTADPVTAALVGRDLNRGRFASRIGILNKEGVIFGLDLIYGLPGDSLSGFKRSLDFALSLYPNNLDLFRLSALPGTPLAEKAAEFGITAETKAPYSVLSTRTFPAADMAMAEQLSRGTDVFYNRGRAVAWFNQVLRPLGIKPSAFLNGFTGRTEIVPDKTAILSRTAEALLETAEDLPDNSIVIEKTQLAYLEEQYSRAKKSRLFPAVRDVVRYHGAWGRALAEGAATDIEFTYHPDDILGAEAQDIAAFVDSVRPCTVKARMQPGKEGPELIERQKGLSQNFSFWESNL